MEAVDAQWRHHLNGRLLQSSLHPFDLNDSPAAANVQQLHQIAVTVGFDFPVV
jgi:hypothetical protein